MDRIEKLNAILKEIRREGNKEESIVILYTKQAEKLDGVVGCIGQTAALARLLIALLRSNVELEKVLNYYKAKAEVLEIMKHEDFDMEPTDKN